MSAALVQLISAGAGDRRNGPGPVVGYIGADVPVEYLTAAELQPLRLSGDPDTPSEAGDRYLGTGLDPAARSILTRILDADYGPLDGIVVSRDCEASSRLFYALRELRRVEPSLTLPPVHLVDVLHLPHRTTTRYVRAKLAQFRAVAETWAGRAIDDAALTRAIGAHDRQRDLLAAVSELRRARPARLTGTDVLRIVAATTALPVGQANELLEQLLAQADELPEHDGTRVFLTGSSHDTPHVYEALETMGFLIVGEDHDRGGLLHRRRTGTPTEAALAERYQHNGPAAPRAAIRTRAEHTRQEAAACGAEVLISCARIRDDAPSWDYTAQATATGLPSVLLSRQPYGGLGAKATEALAGLRPRAEAAR